LCRRPRVGTQPSQPGRRAIADITLWELALLQERGRLRLEVLPITPEIALLSLLPGLGDCRG
jgi:hypothetical protein